MDTLFPDDSPPRASLPSAFLCPVCRTTLRQSLTPKGRPSARFYCPHCHLAVSFHRKPKRKPRHAK